jgi:pimeloyl-ACP methyl ester carboxylesterase
LRARGCICRHSLGGLVVLNALALDPKLPVGRVVLLGTRHRLACARQLARSPSVGPCWAGRAGVGPGRGAVVAARCEVGMIRHDSVRCR